MNFAICAAAAACFVGALIFGLTTIDAYSDWTNLNCAQDAACWATDWREVALDSGGTVGCFAGAMALLHAAFPA